jgi:acetate CoA/acetoacetate CoA-transferase alpha subunit
VDAGLVKRTIASHIGLNPETQKQMLAGEMRGRAGAAGHADRAHPRRRLRPRRRADATGVGTVVEEGKQRIEVDGKSYLLETALRADFALVQAFLADYLGNLPTR